MRLGPAILANEWISIYGDRYFRGTRPIRGFKTQMVGYKLSCSLCDWTQRVNGPLNEARKKGRSHARYEHGLRGLYSDGPTR